MSNPLSEEEDRKLRSESVDKAIKFMEPRVGGDMKTAQTSFIELYTKIYEFISKKPYRDGQ